MIYIAIKADHFSPFLVLQDLLAIPILTGLGILSVQRAIDCCSICRNIFIMIIGSVVEIYNSLHMRHYCCFIQFIASVTIVTNHVTRYSNDEVFPFQESGELKMLHYCKVVVLCFLYKRYNDVIS